MQKKLPTQSINTATHTIARTQSTATRALQEHLLTLIPKEFLPHVIDLYTAIDLKQGAIKKHRFTSHKNISDIFPEIKSQFIKNTGYRYIHVGNWMNEDTYFYISQGEGVRCVKLPALTGKYIRLKNANDVEFLIGSEKMLYRTKHNSFGDVYSVAIYFVTEIKSCSKTA